MVGADFANLESRVDALLTKDPNKLQVYTDGYDSHSLSAFIYFPEDLVDIVNEVASMDKPGKFYKVTYDDGSAELVYEPE